MQERGEKITTDFGDWFFAKLTKLYSRIFLFKQVSRLTQNKDMLTHLLGRSRQSSYQLSHYGFHFWVVRVQMPSQIAHKDNNRLAYCVVIGCVWGCDEKLLKHWQ